MTSRLFVYGTLAPGRPNEHVLADIVGTWQPATMRGHLHHDGWGAELGYPAIVPDSDAGEVEGFVFTSDELDEMWDRLDAFEGDGYERVTSVALLDNGASVDAQVYVLRRGQG